MYTTQIHLFLATLVAFILIAAPALSNGIVEANINGRATLVSPSQTHIQTRIREHIAITVTEQHFRFNDSSVVGIVYAIPVPEAVTITQVRYQIGAAWHTAVIRDNDTASGSPCN